MRTAFTNPEARQPADLYRMAGPVDHALDQDLLERLVSLRILGYELANPSRDDDRDAEDGERRKTYTGPTVDSELRRAGITFDGHRSLWLAYERETRRLAVPDEDQEPSNDAEDHRSAA